MGSGNETSAHLLENGRITFLFCAFSGPPRVLRLYGQGRTVLSSSPEWRDLKALFPDFPAIRQIIIADIDCAKVSCGSGVPLMEYTGQRQALVNWGNQFDSAGIAHYLRENNFKSFDGLPTPVGKDAKSGT